jgi:ribosome-associated protein
LTFAPNAPAAWEGTGTTSGGIGSEKTWTRCSVAAKAASSKLGRDIVVLGVDGLLGLTDAFLITSGANPRQVRTITDEIERQLKLAGLGGPTCVEGLDDARWALMDFGDIVVHVFLDEAREFYDLEHLWGDAPRWTWDDETEALVTPQT